MQGYRVVCNLGNKQDKLRVLFVNLNWFSKQYHTRVFLAKHILQYAMYIHILKQ